MFKDQSFKQNLLGVFEISLFMKAGVERFSVSLHDVFRSFFWPLLAFPLALMATVVLSDGGYSPWFLFVAHGLRIVVVYALSLLLVFFFCKKVNRLEFLYQYIIVQNWFEIALLALIAPIFILMGMGAPLEQFESYAIFITLLSYVYSGFILTHALRIPWEMGGFIAVSFLFIDQTGFDVIEFVRDTFVHTAI